MAFRRFLKKAELGLFPNFFLCSGLEQTLRTPKQSFLMKKVKNHRKKMAFRHFLEKAERGVAMTFSQFFVFWVRTDPVNA